MAGGSVNENKVTDENKLWPRRAVYFASAPAATVFCRQRSGELTLQPASNILSIRIARCVLAYLDLLRHPIITLGQSARW